MRVAFVMRLDLLPRPGHPRVELHPGPRSTLGYTRLTRMVAADSVGCRALSARVVDLVDDHALLDAANAKAEQITLNSPFGVALTKEGKWSALEIPGMQAAIDMENRQQIMASATADHRKAMATFLERRSPSFTNI